MSDESRVCVRPQPSDVDRAIALSLADVNASGVGGGGGDDVGSGGDGGGGGGGGGAVLSAADEDDALQQVFRQPASNSACDGGLAHAADGARRGREGVCVRQEAVSRLTDVETDRRTDWQTKRQTVRMIGRQKTDRQKGWQTKRQKVRMIGRQKTDRQKGWQTRRQMDRKLADKTTDRKFDRQKETERLADKRQSARQIGRQKDRQTGSQTTTRTHPCASANRRYHTRTPSPLCENAHAQRARTLARTHAHTHARARLLRMLRSTPSSRVCAQAIRASLAEVGESALSTPAAAATIAANMRGDAKETQSEAATCGSESFVERAAMADVVAEVSEAVCAWLLLE
eukprot:3894919-Pleurochrysis_carterae.AAC.1